MPARPELPLGPRPATPRRDPLTHLSKPRALVLEQLGELGRSATVAEIAQVCGQHPNTVREHLDELVRLGLVTRATARSSGRGRPAVLYLAEPLDFRRPQLREYCALADALAAQVARSVPNPSQWGQAAGVEGARRLVRVSESGPAAAEAAGRELTERHGFDPVDAEDGTIRMRRCPVLYAATQHPEVICALHQGVLTGIYEAHGVAPERAMHIVPFALPGSCLIEFPPAPDAGPPEPPEREPRPRRAAPGRTPS